MPITFGGKPVGQRATDAQVDFAMTLIYDSGFPCHTLGPGHAILGKRIGVRMPSAEESAGMTVEGWVRTLSVDAASRLIDYLKEELRDSR